MGKKLEHLVEICRKYAHLVGSALATGARSTARATVWTAKQYDANQQTIDTLVLTASAATITAAVVDDYTNIGLVGGAFIGAVGAGTLKGVETLAARYLPSQDGEPRNHQLIRYGIIAT